MSEPSWLEIEEQKAKQRRVDAEERLRDILREAFYLANLADTRVTAYQDAGKTPIDEATGCYALIWQALSLMGDDVEYHCETGEFRTIKERDARREAEQSDNFDYVGSKHHY